MILKVIILLVGIALVLWGADKFTDGSSGLARKWHISELVIGLTIVAAGTSLPEFMVSLISTMRGSSDMSVGNIIGSNIFNGLAILGASALMMPLAVDRSLLFRDLPIMFLVSLLLFLLVFFDGDITRTDSVLFIIFFAVYLYYTYYVAMNNRKKIETSKEKEEKTASYAVLVLQIVIGMTALVIGARLMVTEGAELARMWGVSESMIGLTILAGGTSLPELATSMVAAHKGREGLAVGNVIGSNVFNIAGILGICGLIHPMKVENIALTDWITLVGSAILVWILSYTRKKIEKFEGAILLLCFFVYIFNLIWK
ncbi:MAG: calcium/sodium antiporter [Bacteroidaceae bacterium]